MGRHNISVTDEQYDKLQLIKARQEAFFGRKTSWGEFLLRGATSSSGGSENVGDLISGPSPRQGKVKDFGHE